MNTQKKNVLIAKFMGYKEYNEYPRAQELKWHEHRGIPKQAEDALEFYSKYIWREGASSIFPLLKEELKYHKSWDWLIPVVKKVFGIMYENRSENPDFYDAIKYMGDHCIRGNIYKLWNVCVEVIEWYNNNKSPWKSQEGSPYLYRRKEIYV